MRRFPLRTDERNVRGLHRLVRIEIIGSASVCKAPLVLSKIKLRHDQIIVKLFIDIWSLLDRRQRRWLAMLQLLALIMALSTLAGIAAVAPFFAVLTHPAIIHRNESLAWAYRHAAFDSERDFLIALGCAFLSLVLLANVTNLLGSLIMNRFAFKIGNHFCTALFNEYIHREHQFHLATNSSTLFNNIVWEATRGTTSVLQSAFILNTNAVAGLLIMLSIVILNPLIALVTMAALAGSYFALYTFVRQRLSRNGQRESRYAEERTKTVNETLGGMKEISLLRGQQFFLDKFERACRAIARSAVNTQAIAQSPRYILECIVVAGLVGIALWSIGRDQANSARLAQLSFLGFAAYRLLPALQQIFYAAVRIRADQAAFYRIADDLRRARRTNARGADEYSPTEVHAPPCDIELHNVSFSYAADRAPAISDVSLRIPAGATVGIVGRSGSGKTTLVELMLGLLAPTAGSVVIAGRALDTARRKDWWLSVAYVPQHIFLFDASLAENVAVATAWEHIDFERLAEALQRARLDRFVATLPNGCRELIGERGVRLSGGQRQRLGIARALYRRASTLILDEATNALDGMTESEIMDTLETLRGRCTVILIAHRLNTVRQCDAIFQLTNGALAGSGDFEQLMHGSTGFRSLIYGGAARDAS